MLWIRLGSQIEFLMPLTDHSITIPGFDQLLGRGATEYLVVFGIKYLDDWVFFVLGEPRSGQFLLVYVAEENLELDSLQISLERRKQIRLD